MTIFHAVNMPMGFVVLFAFSTSFSSSENHVMHPVRVRLSPSLPSSCLISVVDLSPSSSRSFSPSVPSSFARCRQSRQSIFSVPRSRHHRQYRRFPSEFPPIPLSSFASFPPSSSLPFLPLASPPLARTTARRTHLHRNLNLASPGPANRLGHIKGCPIGQ